MSIKNTGCGWPAYLQDDLIFIELQVFRHKVPLRQPQLCIIRPFLACNSVACFLVVCVARALQCLLDAAPSPGKEAEEGGRSESSPREPDEGGIGLSLSAAIDAIDVLVYVVLAVYAPVDDVVMGEVGAHRMRLTATAIDWYPCSKSLLRARR